MSFEGKIIQVSKIKESRLLNPAMIAAKNPDTGITVQNKSARGCGAERYRNRAAKNKNRGDKSGQRQSGVF